MIEEGKPAPTFTLPSDSGETVSLDSFRGKPVILYFYPKDDTHVSNCSKSRVASELQAPFEPGHVPSQPLISRTRSVHLLRRNVSCYQRPLLSQF